MKKRKTNIEFLADLMDFSREGPLMQAFVLTAIQKYAQMVIENPIPDTPMLSGDAWTRCAKEALNQVEEHFK